MRSSIDCHGVYWKEIELKKTMKDISGQQHDKPISCFCGLERFEKQKKNDLLKNQYASSHNIPLVRIPYYKRDSMNLSDLLGPKYLI